MSDAQKDRDAGMSLVLDNASDEWKDGLYNYIHALPTGWQGTAEDIRVGYGCAAHAPQAWGAVINAVVRRNWLRKTGSYQQMQTRTSHARETRVYERTDVNV